MNRGEFKYNANKLNDELNFANKVNKKFEDALKKEVHYFDQHYSFLGEVLIKKFLILYNFIMNKESKILK